MNSCTAIPVERTIPANVTVDPIVIPDPATPGVYSISGTTCFDVAQTDGGVNCGALSGRTNAFAPTKTFTYTFVNSASFSSLTFVKEDASSIIKSINYPGGNTVNVTFDDYITDIARGTDNTTAKTAILYAVFNDNTGTQRKVALKLTVKDCICCGSNGTAGIMVAGSNTYLTHFYNTGVNNDPQCWMVSNSIEGTYTARYWSNNATYNNGAYYTWAQAANACPPNWSLPTQAQFEKLKNAVNDDKGGIGKWWATSEGNAFAGHFNGTTWVSWNSSGDWWTSTKDQRYGSKASTGLYGPGLYYTDSWSVRCVKND